MQNEQKPRLDPVMPSDWDGEILAALGAFPNGLKFVLSHWEDDGAIARGAHVLGFLARYPALAKAFLTFNNHVSTNSTLTARERELLILRISWLRKSEYELVMHRIIGRRVGITEAQLELIQAGPDAPGWNEEDADLIRVSDDLCAHGSIGDKTWERLSHRYSHRQILDMIFLVGCYETLAMAIKSFRIPLEAGVEEPLDPDTRARLYGTVPPNTVEK